MNGLQTQICPSKFPNPRPNFYYPPDTSIRIMAVSKFFYNTHYM